MNKATFLEGIPLVRRTAYRLVAKLPTSVHVDDLIQVGLIGLIEAVEKYKDDQNAQFSTYASQRIQGAMLDELRRSDWLPREVRRKQRTLDKATLDLSQSLGRKPSASEVAKSMNVSIEEFHSTQADSGHGQTLSYDAYADEESRAEFLDRHAETDSESDLSVQLGRKQLYSQLVDSVDQLPERERELMYSLYDQALSFQEVAAQFGITESRARQIHARALSRIRKELVDVG